MLSTGRQLHAQVEEAREKGNILDALKLSDEALLAYQADGDKQGLSELLSSRSIIFRHLYEKTQDKNFLQLAKAELEATIKIAKNSNIADALILPLYELANVETELQEYTEAINNYNESLSLVDTSPKERLNHNNPAQNRPVFHATMKNHLAYAEYKNGDKSAEERMEKAVEEIETAEEPDSFRKNTWLSGGYMSLAKMLKEDEPEKAKKYLQKAKEIIDSDERLTVRKEQWEKLAQAIK